MAQLSEIIGFCKDLLEPNSIQDYCPNGLQVEGKTEVHKIVSGVTASQKLIQKSIDCEADLILVHHGYFWKGEPECLVGMKGKRIKQLMQNEISLLAYHLPLDVHPQIGNNALWGQALGLNSEFIVENGLLHGCNLEQAMTITELQQRIITSTKRQPLHLKAQKKKIKKIFWCTGGAQDFITQAAELGADAFLSGEVSERTAHQADELNVHYFACGHHVSEVFGVKALGAKIAERFELEHLFIDITNPV